MRRLIKWIAILAGILVGLIVAAAIALPLFFDPNDFKDRITSAVKEQTGRELTIGGDIGLSVFPWLGVELDKVRLSNAAGFGQDPMASIGHAKVRIKLMPLLSKEVVMDRVQLSDLDVRLMRNKAGTTNWDDLFKPGEEKEPKSQEPESEAGAMPLAALAIGGIDILNARVSWQDASTGQDFSASGFELKTGPLAIGEPLDIALGTNLVSKSEDVSGRLEFAATVTAPSSGDWISLKGIQLKTNLTGSRFPGGKLSLDAAADVELNQANQTLAVSGMKLSLLGMELSGQVNAKKVFSEPVATGSIRTSAFQLGPLAAMIPTELPVDLKAPGLNPVSASFDFEASEVNAKVSKLSLKVGQASISGRVSVQDLKNPKFNALIETTAFDPRPLLAALKQEIPLDRKSEALNPVMLSVKASGSMQNAKVEDIKLQLGGLKVSGKVSAKNLAKPAVDLDLSSNIFNPRPLIAAARVSVPVMADKKALTAVSFSIAGNASPSSASLTRLKLKLDDSSIQGTARIKNFERPDVRFDIGLNQIDLDRYLPPPAKATKSQASTASSAPSGPVAIPIPVDLVRNLTVDGKATVGTLKVMNLKATSILLKLKAKGGLAKIAPLQLKLYQGKAVTNVSLDVRKAKPRMALKQDLSGVQIGKLLKDFMGEDKISGNANLKADVRTAGLDVNALKSGLNGTASFAFKNGAVKGFNLGQMIREAQALHKKTAPPPKESLQTDFNQMSGSLKIKNGILDNQDLVANTPLFKVSGKGQANLPKDRLDYRLRVQVDKSLKDSALRDLAGLDIPVRIKGPFNDLGFQVDLGELLRARAEQEVKKRIDKEREKIKQDVKKKLEDSLKKRLEGLFR